MRIVMLVATGVVILSGCQKPTSTPAAGGPSADIGQAEPDVRLTAAEFHKEVKADKEAAAAKYKGKVIELTGEVDNVGRNLADEAYVTLKAEKDLLGVICFTTDPQPWGKAVRGQKVTIKG